MSSAAIVWPDGRTTVANSPDVARLAPATLGACLAHTPHQLPAGVTSTGAPAPRSVVDCCAWRYRIDEAGAVTVELPAGPGRWVIQSRHPHRLEELPR